MDTSPLSTSSITTLIREHPEELRDDVRGPSASQSSLDPLSRGQVLLLGRKKDQMISL